LAQDRPRFAIAVILIAMLAISVNDMLIKFMSPRYALHQMVLIRSVIGIAGTLVILQFEGGWHKLKTRRPGLHILRALLVVAANLIFFSGLSVLPLGQATAVFFVAPLIITLLSIPVLGERVGPRRIVAVLIGLTGVAVMMVRGDAGGFNWLLLLPAVAAAFYAGMQVLTRKLSGESSAAAMAVNIQSAFIVVSLAFYAVAGDGRHADRFDSPSLQFLFRAWVWPERGDLWLFLLIGLLSTVIGWCLSQAYRSANAAAVAPFEYAALPLAVFWGWSIWGETPDLRTVAGIALIGGAGLYVFARESATGRGQPTPRPRPLRR